MLLYVLYGLCVVCVVFVDFRMCCVLYVCVFVCEVSPVRCALRVIQEMAGMLSRTATKYTTLSGP